MIFTVTDTRRTTTMLFIVVSFMLPPLYGQSDSGSPRNQRTFEGRWIPEHTSLFPYIGTNNRLSPQFQAQSLFFIGDSAYVYPGVFAWRGDSIWHGVYPWMYVGRGVPIKYSNDLKELRAWDPRTQGWVEYKVRWRSNTQVKITDSTGNSLKLRKSTPTVGLPSTNESIDSIHVMVSTPSMNAVHYKLKLFRSGLIEYWRPNLKSSTEAYVVCTAHLVEGEYYKLLSDVALLNLEGLAKCYEEKDLSSDGGVVVATFSEKQSSQYYRFDFQCASRVLNHLYALTYAFDTAADKKCRVEQQSPSWDW